MPSQDTKQFINDSADRMGITVVGIIMAVGLFAFSIFVYNHSSMENPENRNGFLFLFSGGLFILLATINAFLRSATIEFDENGIRYKLFGRDRRPIAWKNVKRIRIMAATPLAGGNTPTVQYFIDATTKLRLPYTAEGPVFFTSTINNFYELASIIAVQSQRYNIPIVDYRQNSCG